MIDVREDVKDYYGNILKSSQDLITNACTTSAPPPRYIKEAILKIHEEVLSKYLSMQIKQYGNNQCTEDNLMLQENSASSNLNNSIDCSRQKIFYFKKKKPQQILRSNWCKIAEVCGEVINNLSVTDIDSTKTYHPKNICNTYLEHMSTDMFALDVTLENETMKHEHIGLVESKEEESGMIKASNEMQTISLILKKNSDYQHVSQMIQSFSTHGNLPVSIYLLKKQACSVGFTPLIYVARKGHVDVMKDLLEKGANGEAKDSSEKTPLIFATLKGNVDIVKYLLHKGANIEGKDYLGKTPLMYAAGGGHLDVVKHLLEKGANIEGKDCL